MKIKKFNLKKLAAIGTAIALQTSGMVANLNFAFAEETQPEAIEEVVENSIEKNMTITIDQVTIEDENNRTTTTTQEASGSYSTREEAEQAVTEAIDHLVEEGYTPTETEIIEVPAGSHTEEGEHISESEGHFETREEAETAMDERVSELEEQGYRIDDAEVSQTEEEHQVGTDHSESSEASEITYESSEEAQAAAEDRISEIEEGLGEDQTLDHSVEITTDTRKTGEEVDHTDREAYLFMYDAEAGTYVNDQGQTLESYIESTQGSLEETGHVNIQVDVDYTEGHHTEIDPEKQSEHYASDNAEAAQTELARIQSIYTKENGYANVTITTGTHTVKIGEHTEYSEETTGTYNSEEEAESALRDVVGDLLEQGYQVSEDEVKITERRESHEEAIGDEYTETSSTQYDSEEEAEAAMEERISELEATEDYGNIEGTVEESEKIDHYEVVGSGEKTQDYRIDGRYTTEAEARSAAQDYLRSLNIQGGHILQYTIDVTSGMAPTGEQEVKQTDTVSTMHFTLNENGVYVNEEGVDLDKYIAAAKFAAGENGYVNVKVSTETYTDGSHTEAGEAIHETGTYDTMEAATEALAQLGLKYTEENGYTNITVGEIVTRQVEDGTETATDSREAEGVSEADRDSTTQRLVQELEEDGYTVTEQDVEVTPFEVTVRDEQGNIEYDYDYDYTTDYGLTPETYDSEEEAQDAIAELEAGEYQDRLEESEDGTAIRYSYSFTIKPETRTETKKINDTTYDSLAEAEQIIAQLKAQGYDVDYTTENETETIQVTVNRTFTTEQDANAYAQEVEAALEHIYEDIQVTKRATGKTESHEVTVEDSTNLTLAEAEARLTELEAQYTDTDETTYNIEIVRATDENGDPATTVITDKTKEVSETFTTLEAARAYIESLKEQRYNDVSGLQIKIDYTTTETWEDQEHAEVDIDPDHEEKIYHYDHLDIIYGGGNGKTTMTYVDLTAEDPAKQSYTIEGALHVSQVVINNGGVKQTLEMESSVDAGRGDNEYKSERGFGLNASGRSGYHFETIFINGKNRYFKIYNQSPINDNTIVTIDGKLEYTNPVTGVVTTIPYQLTGKLNGGTNKCQNTTAWGYDLTFSSITIINESVLIDANIDYEYKVIGEAIATHIAEAYDIEVTQTDHEMEYVVTGKGDKQQETGRVILSATAEKEIPVYRINVYELAEGLVSRKETRYDIKVSGSKLVQLYKDVYDINLDCNVLDTIIDENKYLDVELTGDIMQDILAKYFGYVVTYKDMAPVMAKYYTYNITANEMKEIIDIYYDIFVKGHKIVEEFKTVYDIDVDYNVINTIIDKYAGVTITGDIMKDIMTEYFGYIIKLDVMTPIMEKYYGYEISATEMKEILDYYYRVVVKGEKVEVVPIEDREPTDIPKTGQDNRLTVDLTLMASALLAGSAFALKKKKDEEEEEKGKAYRK